jgi:transposase InsO family protein
MTEEEKQEVTAFRFSIIHDLIGPGLLNYGEKERLLKEKCARQWIIPHSPRSSIGKSTILSWVKAYMEGGGRIQSLYPQGRCDNGKARRYDKETCLTLIRLRKEMSNVSVPHFIKEVNARKVFPAGNELKQTTLYRFFHQEGIMTKKQFPGVDRRKFEAELPNDMWQSDVMHGPKLDSGSRRLRKTYLIAFIDDHSRLITHGRFYPAESLACFIQAFEQALLIRGLPRKLYVDNGAAFRSKQLAFTCASLGIALIHAKPYTPQGKGKIERFFRTVRSQFLPCFKGASLEDINEAFESWLRQDYQQRKHSSTGESPFKRFTSHMECIRCAPRDLSDHFRKTVRRRVNKDRTVTIDNRLFEAPVELIGKRVELLYHENKPEFVEIRMGSKSLGNLQQVDLHINCRVKRDKNCQVEIMAEESTPATGQLWEES